MAIDSTRRRLSSLVAFISAIFFWIALGFEPATAAPAPYTYCHVLSCFDSLEEAEAHLRSSPGDPAYAVLQPAYRYTKYDGTLVIAYAAPNQPPEILGDIEYWAGRALSPEYACTPANGIWSHWNCADEGELISLLTADISKDNGNFGCYATNFSVSGSYVSPFADITALGGTREEGFIDYTGDAGGKTLFYDYTCPNISERRDVALAKYQHYKCGPGFKPDIGMNDEQELSNWPQKTFCKSDLHATIETRLLQVASCPANNNPCYPATGEKIRTELSYEFAGRTFNITYRSHGDYQSFWLPRGWIHSYEEQIVSFNGQPNVFAYLDQTGNYDYFEFYHSSSTTAQAKNSPGKILVRNATQPWLGFTLKSANGDIKSFSGGGKLLGITNAEKPENNVVVTYDTSGGSQSTKVSRVVDAKGRALEFTHIGTALTKITTPDGKQIELDRGPSGNLESITFDGATKSYQYEPGTILLNRIDDESGSTHGRFAYDDKGRVIQSALLDSNGNFVEKTTLEYTGDTTVTVVTDGKGTRYFSFEPGLFRKLLSVEDAQGTVTNQYNGNTLKARIGHNGVITNYTSASGLTTSVKEAVGTPFERITENYYNFTTLKKERTATSIKSGTSSVALSYAKYAYDAFGALMSACSIDVLTPSAYSYACGSSENAPLGVSQTVYARCTAADVSNGLCPFAGQILRANGPRTDVADTTTYDYYSADDATCATSPPTCPHRKGDLWKVTSALSQITEILKYDGAGRVLSVKDPNNVITDFEYHPRGWLTARQTRGTDDASEADDQITRIEYWPTGLVKKVIQPDGAFTAYAYDAAHRLTDITDNAGNQIHYVLDNAGNRLKEDTKDSSGSLKRTLSRVYNQLGQLATQADAQANPTDFTYDANGNTDTITDALGHVTDNDYDPLNRLARTLQDVGGIAAETGFQYDALDRLTKVTDPKGLDTSYSYNGLGGLAQLQSRDTGTTSYTYDRNGNRKTQLDARGVTTQYDYDALNRLINVAYPDAALSITYTYDTVPAVCAVGESFAIGRLSTMTDGSGATHYCYDRFGNLARKVQTTNGVSFVLRYSYTLAGQLQTMTYPDGTTVDYVRDAQGRTTEVGVTRTGHPRDVLLHQASYHPFGPVASWSYGNGRQMLRSLDQDYRPLAVQDTSTGGLSLNFGFDPVGNLTELTSGSPALSFIYDPLGRLTESRDGPTQVAIDTYHYDKTGNRTAHIAATGTTAYGYPTTSHRLTDVGGVMRGYDAAGNTLNIGVSKEFVYNDANRMSQVKQSSTVAMNYAYNGCGEQVRKHLGTSNTYTLYDEAGHWLGDYDDTGTPLQQALWMDDLPVGLLANGNLLHYIEPDHLGTPRVVIEVNRNVPVWAWDVKGEAFGNTAPNQDPDGDANAFVFNMRFPGQRFDPVSGLEQNGYRDYEALTGRYSQSDPIGLQGGISSYAYGGSQPTMMIDPLGLQSSLAAGGGLAEASGAAVGAYNPNAPGQDFGPKIGGDDVSAFIDVSATLMFMMSPAGATGLLSSIALPRREMTKLEERHYDRHCAGSEDPCGDLKKATMAAIAQARVKMNEMLIDKGKMFATPRWGTHGDGLRGRLANIAAMISLGQKLGCDMSAEIAAATGLFLPGAPQ
ncbi:MULTISPECIES: RHS repeat-associated core domain-containing protein [unclassified Pseudoxanthomonas]|uniref:RHS repeat-associated core domain-containing protein n=1 Tax=unclassified Pseudoxanthomonas TaxID=2645906 RepID=UPI003078A05E